MNEAINSLMDDEQYGIVGAMIEDTEIILLVDKIRPEQDFIPKTIDGIPVIIGVSN